MFTERVSRIITVVLVAPLVIALTVGLILFLLPGVSSQLAALTGWCDLSDASSASEYEQAALTLEAKGNLPCAVTAWQKVVEKRPTEVSGLANLAIRLTHAERYQEALPYYEQAIRLGGGAADLFAWYGRTLRQLNQIQPATDWYYRSLSVNAELADVTAELSELLALQNRHHEAINVLAGYEEITGFSNYFSGRKISLQTAIDSTTAVDTLFRVPKLHDKHFYIASRLSEDTAHKGKVFMIDTGASMLTISQTWLDDEEIAYKTLSNKAQATVANGAKIRVKLVKLPYFKLGPFTLNDVKALVCERCQPLIGQNVLEHFDMTTQRINGVEFLSLNKRGS